MGEIKYDPNIVKSTVSGALSGALAVAVLQPMDLVKIRYQGNT